MGLISGLTKAIKSAASAVSNAVKSGSSSSGSGSSSSGSSSSKSSGSSGSSSGSSSSKSSSYYDPNKDYAAAIAKATSTSEKNQLMAERQNKIDAMNASGTNTGGYSNSVYTGGSSSGSGSSSSATALTPDRVNTILNMYSNVSYDPNVDYAAAIKKASERFGSEPYNVVQGEIDKLENQRYAKMIATGQINASNLASFQPVNYGAVNYGQYTPDYYEKILNDNASAYGAVSADNLSAGYGDLSGYFPTYQQPTYNQNQFDYEGMLNSYNSQFQNMLNSFQKQQESTLNSLKQTQNYNTKVSDDLSNSSRNIYGYDNKAYKGGDGATIKKSNAVSKYLAETAFKDGKFNQGV